MQEKVKLPKVTVDALNLMMAKGTPRSEIVERHIHKDHLQVNNCEYVEVLPTETLISALYIGYEVEQTPEEKVRQTFDYALEQIGNLGDHPQAEHWKGLKTGIITTLAILNIKIEGVNA